MRICKMITIGDPCALILTEILSTIFFFFFQKIYGDESEEFVCGYWGFRC